MRSKPFFLFFIYRHHSSSSQQPATKAAATLSPPKLKNICYRHRDRALKEARLALTEYLHWTRSLPFSVADHIASNSPFSLSLLLSQVHFPTSPSPDHPYSFPSALPRLLRRHLSYRPVNEFDFFSESIGLHPLRSPISSPSLFLSDHPRLLPAVSALARFGFPWTHLGLLYMQDGAIFQQDADELAARLGRFEALGLRRVCVIGICLAFPWALIEDGEDVDFLFTDFRAVFVDSGLDACASEDLKGIFKICRRIRVFYDAGAQRGTMGELIGRNKRVFLEMEEEVLAKKLRFFLKLGMRKEEAGVFVLQHSEILDLDLESPSITMPDYLIGIGFCQDKAIKLSKKYPYVMGVNKLGNLPDILRAMDLHQWFLDKFVNGGNLCYLTPEYNSVVSSDKKTEDEFLNEIERIKSKKKEEPVDYKLEFFFSIGFGKNKFTSKAVSAVNGTKDQLQERFDYLIDVGIGYSTLCRMISATPKLINQSANSQPPPKLNRIKSKPPSIVIVVFYLLDSGMTRLLRCREARPYTPISDEVWARYWKQVEESEGFDVDPFPGINEHAHIVKPIPITEYINTHLLSAIAERNKREKDADGKQIDLVRTIKINYRNGLPGCSLYFTFVAKPNASLMVQRRPIKLGWIRLLLEILSQSSERKHLPRFEVQTLYVCEEMSCC